MYLRVLLLFALIAGIEPAILSADEPELSRFNMMVDKADIVFRGTVIAKEFHDIDAGGMLVPTTYYTFEIHDEFKGESPDGTLIVRMLGGPFKAAKGIVLFNESVGFSLGGEYLVFLAAFDRGTSVLSGGRFRIELGPISGNPVLLTLSGRQALNFDSNGPRWGEGKITGVDQSESHMGVIHADDGELVDEVAVDFESLIDRMKQQIANRAKESTYKPGKKVNHAPTDDWVLDALER